MNNYNYINNRNMQYDNISNYMNLNISNNPNYQNNIKNYNSQDILEPYQGLIRGNLFNKLYNQYKNYNPTNINPTNEKDALLYQWMQYNFALVDLNLYLDIYPNDKNAINLYNTYLNIKKQLCNKYESLYGSIALDNEFNTNWTWINKPWPWEGDK